MNEHELFKSQSCQFSTTVTGMKHRTNSIFHYNLFLYKENSIEKVLYAGIEMLQSGPSEPLTEIKCITNLPVCPIDARHFFSIEWTHVEVPDMLFLLEALMA